MEAFTTLVNVDADTASKLATFLSELLDNKEEYLAQCQELISQSKTFELLNKYLETGNIIFEKCEEKDAQGCFQAFVSILFSLEDKKQELALVAAMASAISSATDHAATRLRVLVVLFNLLVSVDSKVVILESIFHFAAKSNQHYLVNHFYSPMHSRWFVDWKLSVLQRRALLLLAADVLKVTDTTEALHCRVLFLASFASESFPVDVLPLLKSTLVQALASSVSCFQERNMLLEVFVKQGASVSDKDIVSLGELLTIVCKENPLEEFLKFQKSSGDLLTRVGLSAEKVGQTVRLFCLCSLMAAAANKQQEVTYKAIATALQVEESEAELWVIEAVSSGVVEASIDQINGIVVVSRCTHTSFAKHQWKQVQESLGVWRASIVSVRDAVDSNSKSLAVN